MEQSNLVCLGGGHGLGRLLVSLRESGPRLTGIVATTDEGGSTGRLREEAETIAWGDLRNCLSQLCTMDTIGQHLFEYRFHLEPCALPESWVLLLVHEHKFFPTPHFYEAP